MAGDWIKMAVDLPEKPEVWQIAGMVGIDADTVVGKLLKVWRWFDAHTETGNAAGVTYALVDHVTGVTGFGEAMALAGWIEQSGSILSLPHFDRHNGKTAKNRALTAKRVASHKHKSNDEGNAVSVTSALPREEKRREEEKHIPASDDAAPPAAKKPKGETCTLATFLARCRESGVDAIPADDPVHAYAERVGLPGDYLLLAWRWFKAKYGPDGSGRARRYADWRAHFRNAVKDGWPKYWAISGDGAYYLTTAGKQAEREAQE